MKTCVPNERKLKWAGMICVNPPNGYTLEVRMAICCKEENFYSLTSKNSDMHEGIDIIRWCGTVEECKLQCEKDLLALGLI